MSLFSLSIQPCTVLCACHLRALNFTMESTTHYCYHCGVHHSAENMRQIETAHGGKRWRCIASIVATHQNVKARDAFGHRETELNKEEAEAKQKKVYAP